MIGESGGDKRSSMEERGAGSRESFGVPGGMPRFRFLGETAGAEIQISAAQEGCLTSDFRGTRGVGHFRCQGFERGGSLLISGVRVG